MPSTQPVSPGRVILVTGARRGIGAALLVALSEPGRTMIAHNHREAQIGEAEVVAIRARAKGAHVEIMAADLTSGDATRELAHSIIARHGSVDILVNNAARSSYVSFDRITPEEWAATLAVNLTAPFLLAQAVLPGMIERGDRKSVV
jgi:3-oxoacyl-[acyl-carrier protein] reductase